MARPGPQEVDQATQLTLMRKNRECFFISLNVFSS
jgi:hypothetical protein